MFLIFIVVKRLITTMDNVINKVDEEAFDTSYAKALLSCGTDYIERGMKAQELIDYLCDIFSLPKLNIVVYNYKKLGKKCGVIYGFYDFRNIHIYNKIGGKAVLVSNKKFLDTLLHEFMHHYDINYLHIETRGHKEDFFNRIKDLTEKLTK